MLARKRFVIVACLAFAAVTAGRFSSDDPGEAISVLYAIPIAMFAVRYGVLGGLASATLALVAVAAWTVALDVDLSAVGYLSRGVALLSVGAIVGLLGERLVAAQRRTLLDQQVRDLADHVLADLTLAHVALQQADVATAEQAVARGLASTQRLIGGRMPSQVAPGSLRPAGD